MASVNASAAFDAPPEVPTPADVSGLPSNATDDGMGDDTREAMLWLVTVVLILVLVVLLVLLGVRFSEAFTLDLEDRAIESSAIAGPNATDAKKEPLLSPSVPLILKCCGSSHVLSCVGGFPPYIIMMDRGPRG